MIVVKNSFQKCLLSLSIVAFTSSLAWADGRGIALEDIVVVGEKANKTLDESTSSVTVIPVL